MVTSSRLRYHGLRGLTRSFSLDLPVKRSQVHFTSLAVNGLPSCQATPWRSGTVSSVPSSFHDQPVARSGTIEPRLFCGTCSSNRTRLLTTAITGRVATGVASSWIDMLAGLSIIYCRRMPPCFCANAGVMVDIAISTPPATARARRCSIMPRSSLCSLNADPVPGGSRSVTAHRAERSISPPGRLLVEPDVFHAPIIVDAVVPDGDALRLGLPAGGARGVKDYRPGAVLGKPAFDLPNEVLTLFLI